jgi:FdhE protein
MKQSWDQRIARAQELSQQHSCAAALLRFYTHVAAFQKSVYNDLQSGRLAARLEVITSLVPALLKVVIERGPDALAQEAQACLHDETRWLEILTARHTEGDPADVFFARALLQPHTEYLASRADIALNGTKSTCPFCAQKPVVAVLRGEGDGAKRSLVCSLCSTEWEFRRILCPACGEQNKDRLPVYTVSDLDYARLEACDTCRTYMKAIDLTRNGLAVPVVDDVATVALDVWADEKSYTKLMPNLLAL